MSQVSQASSLAAPGIPPAPESFYNATDMEVEMDDSLVVDHDAPVEKTDADFFNNFEDDFDDEDLN